MLVTLLTKKDDHFDLLAVSDIGIDLDEYDKVLCLPYSEIKDTNIVSIAEMLIQESHNLSSSNRWVRPGDVFTIDGRYYVYADANDWVLLNDYKLLPAWPWLIIFNSYCNHG